MLLNKHIAITCLLSMAAALTAQAQSNNDTVVVDRTVYVEREFQPTVQSAGKIAVKPQVYEPQIVSQDPQYSSFSQPLSMDYNVRQLDFSCLNFRHPEPLHGYLQAGVGHVNSLFEFNYRVTDSQMQKSKKKKASNDLVLDLHANHLGQWGRKTISESSMGFDFSKQFTGAELYFGAAGRNDYFTRYGAYYAPDSASSLSVKRFREIEDQYRQTIWMANAKMGVKSLPNADIRYQVQAGYEGFYAMDYASEHQVHTEGMLDWSTNYHHVGLEADIQNRLYYVPDTSVTAKNNHRIHIAPYYAYEGKRFRIHAGVNLDFSAGKGRVAGISPDIRFEADLTKNWLALYAELGGNYEANGAQGEYAENRYRALGCLFVDTISGSYTPIDAALGFKIRPYETLLINLHVGYELTLDKHVNVFGKEQFGLFEHEAQNIWMWKFGADIHYHYRDVVTFTVGGNYFVHGALKDSNIGDLRHENGKAICFDEPEWEVRFRIDGKINQKWSLYSDNYFSGGTHACVYDLKTGAYSAAELRPRLDLNLGVQYNVNRWLSVYAQLNNYLAWTNKLAWSSYYGYEAQRANCMFGLSWSF